MKNQPLINGKRRPHLNTTLPRLGHKLRAACRLCFLLGAGALWADELVLQSPCVQNQRFSFVFNAQTNITYSVQYATTLAPPNWATTLSVVGSNGAVAFLDPDGIGQARFYRVVQQGLTIPASDVRAVASGLYDQIQQPQPLDPAEVSLFFSVFGIATLESTNDTAYQAAVAAQAPFMFDFQVQAIANKLVQSWFVSWDSFIAQMADLGAADRSGQPLSRSYLTAQLAPLLTKDPYQYSELLPALVLALGQERASRCPGGDADPVLGDDLMDPIQFNLMAYGCMMASLGPGPGLRPQPSTPITHRPKDNPIPTLTGWAPGLARGAATAWLGEQIGFPLGYKASPQAVVCASIVLYSYDVQVTPDPDHIYQKSDPPNNPYQSQITATVNFNFRQDIDSLPKQIALWAAGCDFPQPGAQNNVQVEWEITDELPQHGMLTQLDTLTRDGQAQATYEAFDEPVPPVFQAMTSPKAAIGYVSLRVMNVLPKWSKLVAIVRLGNPNLAAGKTSLTVYYYKWPQLTLDFDSELSVPDAGLDSRILATGIPLQLVKNAQGGTTSYSYQGQQQETYATFHCPLEGDNPGVDIAGLVGGQFQATIPVQPGMTAADLEVMVDVGKPQENVVVVTPQSATPATWYWFLDQWALAHSGELVTDTTSPYVGRYAIGGWQASGSSTLVRQYAGGTGEVTENTTLKLVGTPGQ